MIGVFWFLGILALALVLKLYFALLNWVEKNPECVTVKMPLVSREEYERVKAEVLGRQKSAYSNAILLPAWIKSATPDKLNIRYISKPSCIESDGSVSVPDSSWFEFYVIQTMPNGYFKVLNWTIPAQHMGHLRSDWILSIGENRWTKEFNFPSGPCIITSDEQA